jgi:rhodanese-related sulfurtransferase
MRDRRPRYARAKQLKDIGFTNVTAVVMELADWQKKGLPFLNDESK